MRNDIVSGNWYDRFKHDCIYDICLRCKDCPTVTLPKDPQYKYVGNHLR